MMTAQTLYYTMYGKCKTIHGTPTVESKNEQIDCNETPILHQQKLPPPLSVPPSSSYFHKILWSW